MMNMLGLGGGVDPKDVSVSIGDEQACFDDTYHLGGELAAVVMLCVPYIDSM